MAVPPQREVEESKQLFHNCVGMEKGPQVVRQLQDACCGEKQGKEDNREVSLSDDQISRILPTEHSYLERPQRIHSAELESESEECMKRLEERVQEAQQKRKLENSVLIDFITGNISMRQHLEAIITGHLHSSWEDKKEMARIYFHDDEQLHQVVSFLFGVIKATPRSRQLSDEVAFVLDVLLPEATVLGLAEVHSLSSEAAMQKYKQGPQFEQCELEQFNYDLLRNMSEEATERLQRFTDNMERALQSEEFLKRL